MLVISSAQYRFLILSPKDSRTCCCMLFGNRYCTKPGASAHCGAHDPSIAEVGLSSHLRLLNRLIYCQRLVMKSRNVVTFECLHTEIQAQPTNHTKIWLPCVLQTSTHMTNLACFRSPYPCSSAVRPESNIPDRLDSLSTKTVDSTTCGSILIGSRLCISQRSIGTDRERSTHASWNNDDQRNFT